MDGGNEGMRREEDNRKRKWISKIWKLHGKGQEVENVRGKLNISNNNILFFYYYRPASWPTDSSELRHMSQAINSKTQAVENGKSW